MFEFINRYSRRNLIAFSGWGFDHCVLRQMDMPFNYYLYKGSFTQAYDLTCSFIKSQRLENVSILGWSMGAYVASDIACAFDCEEVILVSARPQYLALELHEIKKTLTESKNIFLRNFYRKCFTTHEREAYKWFAKNLQPSYMSEFLLNDLMDSLDILASYRLDVQKLSNIKSLSFVHGTGDKIAPFQEIQTFTKSLPNARLVTFNETGHLPFLKNNFAERIYG